MTTLVPVTGPVNHWIRDGAWAGALSGAFAAVGGLVPAYPLLLLWLALHGALAGAVLGAITPGVLEWLRPRVSLGAVVGAMATLGMVGGAVAGATAALALGGAPVAGAIFAAFVGGIQATLWGLAYLVTAVTGRPRRVLVLASGLTAAPAGAVAVALLSSAHLLFGWPLWVAGALVFVLGGLAVPRLSGR